MGRGSNQSKALDAKSLLFGPRRGQILSPEAKKQLRRQQRQQISQGRKAAYGKLFDQAREQLAKGDGETLKELLAEPAGHGLKGVEKEQLKQTVEHGCDIYHQAIDPDDDRAEAIATVEDLAGLAALAERCREIDVGQSRADKAARLFHSCGRVLANRQLANQLAVDQQQVGLLPAVATGKDFRDHLLADGEILCGKERYRAAYAQSYDRVRSPLEINVDCPDCLARYAEDKDCCDYLSPRYWLRSLNRLPGDELGYLDTDDGCDIDDLLAKAEAVVSNNRARSAAEINSCLAPFSDYRIS